MTRTTTGRVLCAFETILICGIVGCTPKSDPFPEGDKGAVYNLVYEMADRTGQESSFAKLFTSDAVPDLSPYRGLVFIPEGDVSFEGNSVTFQVTVAGNG